jgi:hypothetical protein
MLAKVSGIGPSGVASLQAEYASTHEVVPFDDLSEFGLIGTKGIGIKQASNGVALFVSAVGVHLASRVIGLKIDVLLLDEADDLNIVGGFHELDTGDGAGWDHTRTMTGL